MLVTKPLDLGLLAQELAQASIVVAGLATDPTETPGTVNLHTWGEMGVPVEMPAGSQPVVDAHVAPPRVVDVAGTTEVGARLRTTDATAQEIFRFPCGQKRLYQANLTISGIDATSFASKVLEGRFTWKRNTAGAIMVGITVVSDIHDAAAAAWAPNATASGSDIAFTVVGTAGRTIDWLLVGPIGTFAPTGI